MSRTDRFVGMTGLLVIALIGQACSGAPSGVSDGGPVDGPDGVCHRTRHASPDCGGFGVTARSRDVSRSSSTG